MYAELLFNHGRIDDAIRSLEAVLSPESENIYFIMLLGQCLALKDNHTAAIDVYQKGHLGEVIRDPQTARLHYLHAISLSAIGKRDEAVAELEKVRAFRIDFENVDTLIAKIQENGANVRVPAPPMLVTNASPPTPLQRQELGERAAEGGQPSSVSPPSDEFGYQIIGTYVPKSQRHA